MKIILAFTTLHGNYSMGIKKKKYNLKQVIETSQYDIMKSHVTLVAFICDEWLGDKRLIRIGAPNRGGYWLVMN